MCKYEMISIMAAPGGHASLLLTPQTAILIDSGYAFSAPRMIEMLKQHLQGRPLDYILLTHSHYDHASGSVYCRDAWPNLQVIGSEYAQYVFTRPGALRVIREMNQTGCALYGDGTFVDKLDDLRIDIALGDMETIQLGDVCIQALNTPGHTRDSVSYYWEAAGLLIASETTGTMPNPPVVNPEYLIGYQMTLDAIDRLAALQADAVQLPHRRNLLVGRDEVEDFFRRSRYWAVETKNRVIAAYRQGQNKQQLMNIIKDMYYVREKAKGQPEDAFMLNASYTVPMLVKECTGDSI